MNQTILNRAAEIIAANTVKNKTFAGEICNLSLIDEAGYPSTSVLTPAGSKGVEEIMLCTLLDGSAVKRIAKNNGASISFTSQAYCINLVGEIRVVTDPQVKEAMWYDGLAHYCSGPEDPNHCVLQFTTNRYKIFIDGEETAGVLKPSATKPKLKVTPALGFRGSCGQAIELYQKAFGAQVIEKLRYADAAPEDLQYAPEEKDFIFYSELVIGNQVISMGDDSGKILGAPAPGRVSEISLLIEFEHQEELEKAYALLSKEGKIIVPMNDTSYCTAYVSLVDKFGIHWDLMSGYAG